MTFADLTVQGRAYRIVDLHAAAGNDLTRLPYIHRILLENVLRTAGADAERAKAVILGWLDKRTSEEEIPFQPVRVLMHDTTCGPALVDIAGMRASLAEAGGDPCLLNPVLPVDVSTDHSVGVDIFGTPAARDFNMQREFSRNEERYRFMKWATNVLSGFRVHPPGTGIMHTLNLEQLATVVTTQMHDGEVFAVPDAMIGTDSHTPMVNGIGVLAWGVGGLEAESVMFGMPVSMRVPDVVGVRLTGRLNAGVLATDLALTVTEHLRRINLADRFVEFFGEGVSTLTAGDRSVVANMTPEFGANSGYFAIDQQVIDYLRQTGREDDHLQLVEAYAKRQGLWFDPANSPEYTDIVEIDLSHIEPSLSGPFRPQDRLAAGDTAKVLGLQDQEDRGAIPQGAVVLAAITSCTNTSDPKLVIAAGLVAQKARALGLSVPHWVKTTLAPGSPAAELYLKRAGLLDDLEALGFAIVGYGCTTCIGNSGPLVPLASDAIDHKGLKAVAVLSGNRNFPGRVHAQVPAGFLASPPMVVAFALAGDANRNIQTDAIGTSAAGAPVYLSDIWPTDNEIVAALIKALDAEDYAVSSRLAEGNQRWKELEAPATPLFPFDDASTYIRRPPFADFGKTSRLGNYQAWPLMILGDDITTDHISPAGQIPKTGEAADYLIERGDNPDDLNVFASRRGNWEAMVRGLFTNPNVVNYLDRSLKAGETLYADSGERLSLWHAAQRYHQDERSTVIVAGARYGMGSSRDWAAKGVALLGVRAVIAKSFERIHRSNLAGMGILPLRIASDAFTYEDLNLQAGDRIEINAPVELITPRCAVDVTIIRSSGERIALPVITAIETQFEVELLRNGGILPFILRRTLQAKET